MPHARSTLARLWSPGQRWLTGGVAVVLVAVVTLVLQAPTGIDEALKDGFVQAIPTLLLWFGGVGAIALGVSAVVYGLLDLAARDRLEARTEPEAVQRSTSFLQRMSSGILLGSGLLAGGVALSAATPLLHDPVSDGDVAVGLIGLGGVGVVAGLAIVLLTLLWGSQGDRDLPPSLQPDSDALAGLHRPVPRLHLGLLTLLTFLAVALQLTLIRWYIEDAAISFAYSRHLAAGEGLVTYPGGERVEGYSNPLWTFLMAAFYLVRVDGFVSSKVMGVVFASLTVPITYFIAREARPHRADVAPLLAVAVVASSAQFIIWGASGLENSLLNVLVAGAIWRTLVEARRGGMPWSAVLYFAVAVTRPEAILYAALGGFAAMVFRFGRVLPDLVASDSASGMRAVLWRGIWPTMAWLALFFTPFLGYHAWRYDYFAWPAPNTYYAKKGNPGKSFSPYDWNRGGWKYVHDYGYQLWQTFFVPVYVVGLLGTRGVRLSVGALVLAMLGLIVAISGLTDAFPEWFGEPTWWQTARPWLVLLAAVLPLPFAAGRPGWRALTLCWGTAAIALFFALYAGGDWMAGFRWMSSLVVPAAVVFAVGAAEISGLAARWLDRKSTWIGVVIALLVTPVAWWFAWGVVASPYGVFMPQKWRFSETEITLFWLAPVLVAVAVAIGVWGQRNRRAPLRWGPVAWMVSIGLLVATVMPAAYGLNRHIERPVTSPYKVKKRVNYMNYAQRRLHMQRRPVLLDVDMGANMYWSDDEILDVAGLVDVSMGHHWFETAFMKEYIFEERRPDFAHVHGGWARASKLPGMQRWTRDYLEIPGYPAGKRALHIGNHIRKDLLAVSSWQGTPGRRVAFSTGIILDGWEAPATLTAPGRRLFVETALRTTRTRAEWENIRVVGFLSNADGVLVSWDLPPGYDWYTPHDWTDDESVYSRFSVKIPLTAQPGKYDLGFVLMGTHEGAIMRPIELSDVPDGAVFGGRDGALAAMAEGEVRWTQVLEIADEHAVDRRSDADLAKAIVWAEQGRCVDAQQLFYTADRRTSRTGWVDRARAVIRGPLAACWASSVPTTSPLDERVQALRFARSWDHHEPSTVAGGQALSDELITIGRQARDRSDWQAAYPAFRDAMWVAPWRSDVRVLAEEARDCRLRIHNRSCSTVPNSPRVDADLEDTGSPVMRLQPPTSMDSDVAPTDPPDPAAPAGLPLAVPVGEDGEGDL